MEKNCFYCNSKIVSKSGIHKGIQRYQCAACCKRFLATQTQIDNTKIWDEYAHGKQTYAQLAVK